MSGCCLLLCRDFCINWIWKHANPFFKKSTDFMLFLPFCEYINKYICTIYTSTSCSVFFKQIHYYTELGLYKKCNLENWLKIKIQDFQMEQPSMYNEQVSPMLFCPTFFWTIGVMQVHNSSTSSLHFCTIISILLMQCANQISKSFLLLLQSLYYLLCLTI